MPAPSLVNVPEPEMAPAKVPAAVCLKVSAPWLVMLPCRLRVSPTSVDVDWIVVPPV
ncbi:hypothetical protein D3C87_2056790 [compost metagenome]